MDLKIKIDEIVNKNVNYKGQLKAFKHNFDSMRNEYSELKSIIELNPSVNEFLKILQLKQHEKSVGTYEKLLTSLLMEVLPGYREIILNLTTLRQAPALDVLIKKDPNNPLEDVIRGTGGSVTNIIVAGFRIISVIRSGNRKFLLLDEPDCWLKEDYFPAFSKMLKEVSEKLGVQMLLISHDKNSYFSGSIDHQVEIYKDSSGKINSRFNELPDWDYCDDIIKSIRLENFQSHEDTFIPLSPTITILRGDNDLGKSSIASAFRSVFYGEGAETDIKHFTNKSTVTIEFNNEGKCLVWERKIKGSPLESYTLYSNTYGYNSPLHKTSGLSRGNTPDWLMTETGLGKFEDLDVQLTWQKEPLAFLSSGPHVRAKALSIGAEVDHVQKMMVLAKKKNTENKSLLKSKEVLIEKQRQYIIPLKKSLLINEEDLMSKYSDLIKTKEKIEKLKNLINSFNDITLKGNILKGSNIKNIILSEKRDIKSLKSCFLDLNNGLNKSKFLEKIISVSKINIKNDKYYKNELIKVINDFDYANNRKDLLKNNNLNVITIDQSITNKIKELKSIGISLSKNIKTNNVLTKIKDINNITIINEKYHEKMKIKNVFNEFKSLENKNIIISSVKLINIVKIDDVKIKEDIKNIKSVGVNLKNIMNEIEIQKSEILKYKKEYEILNKEIKELYPICPTCNQKWDHKH